MQSQSNIKAKPFLKWAGGKTQLLPTIDAFLPENFKKERNITYIEPFVGGGALLFHMLQNYPNIERAIINDINPRLIKTYSAIRNHPRELISALKEIEAQYRPLTGHEAQKDFFMHIRSRFNTEVLLDVETAAYMIFLNRTCFNGLYRENSKGGFNVPFGKYINPTICDEQLILADSRLLQKVEIINGDFANTAQFIEGYTFFYFDPPYRPLDATSNFNSYVKESFNDDEQRRLKEFYAAISANGCYGLLSNSDGRSRDERNLFFDDLYADFTIERVSAKRCINANGASRGALTELLIRNYHSYQGRR